MTFTPWNQPNRGGGRPKGSRSNHGMEAQEVIKLRKRLGLTLAELGTILGYSASAVHHWEKNHCRCPLTREQALKRVRTYIAEQEGREWH